MAVRAETQVDLARVNDGTPGANGATFTPSVDASGNISWTNDGGLPNPATQNIKGPQGDEGPTGPQGPTGPAGPGISYVTLQAGDDINNCIGKDTIYVTSSTAVCNALDTNYPGHMPSGFPAGELQLEVIWMGDNNYLVQRLTCKNGAIRKVYLRTYSAGSFGEWTEEGVSYGTSSTAASTAAKTATISNWNRDSDPYVAIKFTNENTASSPTLNINSTGAASIMTNGSNSAYWAAGATVNFYWDGTYYQVANSPVYASTVTVGNPSGDNVFIGNSAVQVRQGSSVKAEFKATEASLGGNKAKVKYTEDAGVLGLASHRIVVCKSSNDAGTRNDAVLTSLDLANFDLNSTPMAFIDGGHMVSGANKGADAGLYVFDGNGDINYIYVGIGGQGGTTALGNSVGIKSSNNVDIDADNNINIVGNNVKIIGDKFWATDDGDVYVDRWLTVGQDIVTPSIDVDGATLTDFVAGKGKSGSWYYQFWKSGKIEAWGSNITTSTATVTRVSSMLYRAYNVSVSIPSDIFDSTPTMAMVSPNYGSTNNVQLVSAMATCSSATSLRVQLWKNGNSSDGVALNFYVVYFPSTY